MTGTQEATPLSLRLRGIKATPPSLGQGLTAIGTTPPSPQLTDGYFTAASMYRNQTKVFNIDEKEKILNTEHSVLMQYLYINILKLIAYTIRLPLWFYLTISPPTPFH